MIMASGNEYAFISYSSSDKIIADKVRTHLMSRKCPCWMAPYDIPAGSRYAHALNDALENCGCLLLLLSDTAQQSEFVEREVERAVTYGKPIIAVRLENLVLNSGFKFYIGSRQIIDAFDLGTNPDSLSRVSDALRAFISFAPQPEKPSRTSKKTAKVPVLTKKTEQSEWLSPYEDLIEEGENEFNCGRDEKAREIFRRLIELGEPIGYVKLANSFRGELSAKEEAERIALCRKARPEFEDRIKDGQARYYYWLACICGKDYRSNYTSGLNDSDSKEYFRLILNGAKAGDPKAQYHTAMVYYSGLKDMSDYFYWLLKASEQNHTASMLRLAQCFRKGSGTEKNPKAAILWEKKRFETLLDQYNERHTVARIMPLAASYKTGKGCQKNTERSIALYKEAAAMGSPEAAYQLGVIYWEEENYAQAVNYLKEPAENMDRMYKYFCQSARAMLGEIYEEGKGGVKRDLSQAKKYYRMIIESPVACYMPGGIRFDAGEALRRVGNN